MLYYMIYVYNIFVLQYVLYYYIVGIECELNITMNWKINK